MASTLRVGSPAFLVARPLDLGLEAEPGLELVHAVPARLVQGLRDGSLDVALVSSIELFRRPGYRFLDGPAVCGRGEVRSVQVFLRRTLAQARRVVLDPASRAAQVLTRIVLPARLSTTPEFLEVDPGEDPGVAAQRLDADAWLAIGDAALRQALAPDAPPAFSPSAAWTEDTGLPFVFAVWIARPGLELDEGVLTAFAAARARGSAALEELAAQAAPDLVAAPGGVPSLPAGGVPLRSRRGAAAGALRLSRRGRHARAVRSRARSGPDLRPRMPRLIEQPRCPHCGEGLPEPKPRACPACAGSLQQRYLRAGCLSSAPRLLLLAAGVWWIARSLHGR